MIISCVKQENDLYYLKVEVEPHSNNDNSYFHYKKILENLKDLPKNVAMDMCYLINMASHYGGTDAKLDIARKLGLD